MSPELIQAISGLGALGFAIIAVWALGTGKVRVGSLVDRDTTELKNIATSASKNVGDLVPAVRELTNAVEVVDQRAAERYDRIREEIRELRAELKK